MFYVVKHNHSSSSIAVYTIIRLLRQVMSFSFFCSGTQFLYDVEASRLNAAKTQSSTG